MSNNNYCVYQHISPTNKSYFGIHNSNNVNKRWANGLGYRTQPVFFRAIIKYGWDNFKDVVLYENLSEEEAKNKEKELIAKYKTNCSIPGNKNGYNMTDGGDSCPSIYFREDENYKRTMDEKVYSKIRKPVNMYDVNGNFIKKFNSITEAGNEMGCGKQEISKCTKGKRSNVHGYIFKYADNSEQIDNEKIKMAKRKVNQFSFNGDFICSHESCTEASRYVNFGSAKGASIIAKCAKGERASYRGYLWSYNDNPYINNKRRMTRNTPVDMYSLDGQFMKHFDCILDAKRYIKPETKSVSQIVKCCKNEAKSAYGYKWCYTNEMENSMS